MMEEDKDEIKEAVIVSTNENQKKDLNYLDGFNDLLSEWCNLPWKKRYSLAWDLCFTPGILKDKMEGIVKDQKQAVIDGRPVVRSKLEEM